VDHVTRKLVESVDEQIRRAEMRIEQQRLSIIDLDPMQRRMEKRPLERSLEKLDALFRYRGALLSKIAPR